MKPIEIQVSGDTPKSPQEICAEFLDTERWPDFKGYSILPGIKNARFEHRTADLVGSRIKVDNTDGSSHVEESIEWDANSKLGLRFQEFSAPLAHLASHFIETWSFSQTDHGTRITRTMILYPKGLAGWIMLVPISRLMKKAFEKNR